MKQRLRIPLAQGFGVRVKRTYAKKERVGVSDAGARIQRAYS